MKRNSIHAFAFVVIAGFLLSGAGCQSMGGIDTPEQKIAASCVAADGALRALTVANIAGKLSEKQQDAVLVAGSKIAIICMAEHPPTLDSVRQAAFDEAIRTLTTLKTEAGSP